MNFITKIFGDLHKDTHENTMSWNDLTQLQQLDNLVTESFSKPVFIFKHSTRCSISRMALKQFENHYAIENTAAYFLDLLSHRDISNAIESRFGVVHQSPQLVLLMDGKCVYTVSHSDIDADELKLKINEHQ